MTINQSEWARPFRLRMPDGTVYHGVEYPNGRVAVDLEHQFHVGLTIEGLLADSPEGATIERPEESRP